MKYLILIFPFIFLLFVMYKIGKADAKLEVLKSKALTDIEALKCEIEITD